MAEPKVSLDLDSQELARIYDSNSNYQLEGGKVLLKMMGVSLGWTVYDIGCGTGLLASHAADIVGPRGRIVGLEPLEERVIIARSRARDNLSFELGDAQDLAHIASESADGAYLNSVLHWVPDPMRAIHEAYRILKPGGRIGISTGSGDYPQPHGIIRSRVLARDCYRGYTGHTQDRPNHTESELRHQMAAAGFRDIKVDMHRSFVETDDEKAMVDFCEAFSFGNYLGHLPNHLKSAVRHDLELEFAKFRTGEGKVRMNDMLRMIAVAEKP
ncbi:hypothetical protein XA68_10318 [Ophiocordyceps unilateralis]|uniref:Methyltransferase type 11 domain-containing protein n=1 Tax=Ophiocordyceps unilateralis TaxID=268505 RepID=A0A2A9PHV5_OPHUN|nr:hypothetical protein XA68_10318 [Ophiocordyceps unilateralis]